MNFPRLRFPFLVSLALLLVPLAVAETNRFDPPNATANHSVDAIVSGVWPNGCVPTVKSVVVATSTVTLHLNADSSSGVCTQVLSSYARMFHLNVLPAAVTTSSSSPIREPLRPNWRACR